MTAGRDSDATIQAWLEAAPRELPEGVRYMITAGVRTTPQRAPRKLLPAALFSLAAAAALFAIAVVATLPRPTLPQVVGSGSTHLGAQAGPLDESGPLSISYGVLEGVDLAVDDRHAAGPDDRTPRAIVGFTAGGTGLYGFGLGASWEPSEFKEGSRGVVIADVTNTKLHGMEGLPLGSDAASFVQVLTDSQWWDVRDVAETSLDGRPAVSGRLVQVISDWWTHLDTVDANGTLIEFMHPSHLIVTDVGDEVVLIQIWAGTEAELDAWMPTAMQFVDTLRFTAAPSGESSDSP